MLGLSSSIAKATASMRSYVKDNLKLYLDFKQTSHNTLKFPCEGSTSFDGTDDYINIADDSTLDVGTGDFTAGFWYKSDGSYAVDEAIISKKTGFAGNDAGWVIYPDSNHYARIGTPR